MGNAELDAALLAAYLGRLGLPSALELPPTVETLRTLTAAHVEKVPYENVDIHCGRAVPSLDPLASARRVALEGRGGYCFLLAGGFGALLHTLGFQVSLLNGNVGDDPPAEASWGNHVVVAVRLAGEVWIADVGLGDGPRLPFRLSASQWEEGGWRYALAPRASGGWRFTHHAGVGSFAGFELDDRAALPGVDGPPFAAHHARYWRDPASPYVRGGVVILRRTPSGVLKLRGRTLWLVNPRRPPSDQRGANGAAGAHGGAAGAAEHRPLGAAADLDGWLALVEEHFGLALAALAAGERDALWARVAADDERFTADDPLY